MKETLLFLHIPKAAGTTLSRVIERQVPARRQYRLGANAQASIEHYNQLPKQRRARYRLISGHFPYGVHERVPGHAVYFTLLRDPVERVASFYEFIRNDPGHPLHATLTPAQMASLEVFARTTRIPVMDNGQTRQLSGGWGERPFGGCSEAMLRQAKRNLSRMAVVGLTERFDESLLLLAQRFGWRRLGYHRQNQTAGKPRRRRLEDSTREALMNLNTFDADLYAFACKRFKGDWAASGLSAEDFHREHPPPGPLREILDRLKSRTPGEWVRAGTQTISGKRR